LRDALFPLCALNAFLPPGVLLMRATRVDFLPLLLTPNFLATLLRALRL
jgi:hypothetical protein